MSKKENFFSLQDLLSKYGSSPNLTKEKEVPVKFFYPNYTDRQALLPSPDASLLSDNDIARNVEAGVREEAQRRGTELVPNPLHPDNRIRRVDDQTPIDPLEQLNQGIQSIGAFFSQYRRGQYDPTPD